MYVTCPRRFRQVKYLVIQRSQMIAEYNDSSSLLILQLLVSKANIYFRIYILKHLGRSYS